MNEASLHLFSLLAPEGRGVSISKVEKIVWSESFGMAGRLDLLAKTNKGLCTIDWKTGKFRTSNRFQKMLNPFDNLDDCEHSKASIQASLYDLMLGEMGIEIAMKFIIHLMPDGNYSIMNAKCLKNRFTKFPLTHLIPSANLPLHK